MWLNPLLAEPVSIEPLCDKGLVGSDIVDLALVNETAFLDTGTGRVAVEMGTTEEWWWWLEVDRTYSCRERMGVWQR